MVSHTEDLHLKPRRYTKKDKQKKVPLTRGKVNQNISNTLQHSFEGEHQVRPM